MPEPRDYLLGKSLFGLSETDLPGSLPPGGTLFEAARARLQHQAVLAVRAAHPGGSDRSLGTAVGLDQSYMTKKLNGHIWLSLEDLLKWALILAPEILRMIPVDWHELFPPGMVSSSFQPGRLATPVALDHDAGEFDWSAVCKEVVESVFRSPDRTGLVEEGALRYLVSNILCDQGAQPLEVFLDDLSTGAGTVSMTMGLGPALASEFVVEINPEQGSTARRRLWAKFLGSLARLGSVGEGQRVLIVASSPSLMPVLFEGRQVENSSFGSRDAEATSTGDPLDVYWEVRATVVAEESFDRGSVAAVEVGKLL